MSVTLMALYRRPPGGDEALAAFRRRYADEHLPLIREAPGLRSLHVARVAEAFSESDLVLVARMVFDDRVALDEAIASEPMRAAARVLREIAPRETVTLLVVEPDPELGSAHAAAKEGEEELGETVDAPPPGGAA